MPFTSACPGKLGRAATAGCRVALVLVAANSPALGQPGRLLAPPATLTGQLTNLRGGRGTCRLALFSSAEGWPSQGGQAVRTLRVPARATSCAFAFDQLPPGTYALAVYQDENEDNRLDTNFVGFPTERFGFSNNARRMMFFPPSFQAACFEVPTTGVILVVRVH